MDNDNTQQHSQAGIAALMQAADLVEEIRVAREHAQKKLEELEVVIHKDLDELESVMSEAEKKIDAIDEETIPQIDNTILDSITEESDEE